ncbi:MAG: GIY-YIG nuclease family protein [Chloroflexi bacterium]|nr:GIY-YIG nuclease family protein [Chloroflexota bacterium]
MRTSGDVIPSGARNLAVTATDRQFHVYILASDSRRLYTGVTSRIGQRVQQHKEGQGSGFTAKYHIDRLVYVEEAPDARSAIEREKQIKAWGRGKKIALIEAVNPGWADLAERWFAAAGDNRPGREQMVTHGEDSSLRSE